METSENVISTKVIDPLVAILTGYNLEQSDEEEVSRIIEKLGEELSAVGFIPSVELISSVDQLLAKLIEEEDEPWEDDDDLDEDDPDLNV